MMEFNTKDSVSVRALVEDSLRQLNYGKVVCDNQEAIDLLMGTWAVESDGGKHTHQMGNGVAHGMWQVEKPTFKDILNRCRENHYRILLKTSGFTDEIPIDDCFEQLIWNHRLCSQVARLKYYLSPGTIPKDQLSQAKYWKKYYNSPLGKGTVEKYIEKVNQYINPQNES